MRVPGITLVCAGLIAAPAYASDEVHITVALSGGGIRAAAFAHGVLRALTEISTAGPDGRCISSPQCLINQIDTISSVSGGTIAAAYFASRPLSQFLAEQKLFDQKLSVDISEQLKNAIGLTYAHNLIKREGLADPAQALLPLYETLLLGKRGWYGLDWVKYYNDLWAKKSGFKRPRFIFNATNLNSKIIFRYPDDLDCLHIDPNKVSLPMAMAASSALPGIIAPWKLEWVMGPGANCPLYGPETNRVTLIADGGIVDNLGLDSAIGEINRLKTANQGAKALIIIVDSEMPSTFDAEPSNARLLLNIAQSFDKLISDRSRETLTVASEFLPLYGVESIHVQLRDIFTDAQNGDTEYSTLNQIVSAGLTGAYTTSVVDEIEQRGYLYMLRHSQQVRDTLARLQAKTLIDAADVGTEHGGYALFAPDRKFFPWNPKWAHIADIDIAEQLTRVMQNSDALLQSLARRYENDLSSAKEEIRTLTGQISDLKSSLSLAQANLGQKEQELAAQTHRAEAAKQDLDAKAKELQETQEKLQKAAAAERSALEEKVTQLQSQLTTESSDYLALKSAADQRSKEYEDLKRSVADKSKEIEALRSLQLKLQSQQSPDLPKPNGKSPAAGKVSADARVH